MGAIDELALHADGLRTAIEANPKFFASIVHYIERLVSLTSEGRAEITQKELGILVERIEAFYRQWRPTGEGLYIPPRETSDTEPTLSEIKRLVADLLNCTPDEFASLVAIPTQLAGRGPTGHSERTPCVFIGHGRNKAWARVKIFLQDELGLATISYESEPRTGETIVPVLEKMLGQATFAVLVVTAEDQTKDGKIRARQNVIHEAGLFQGRLGFRRVALLNQEGVEGFSNIDGLQYIPFSDDKIEQSFYELQRVLRREGQTS